MASLRDIRRRIRSVRNISQITRAMQMLEEKLKSTSQENAPKGEAK